MVGLLFIVGGRFDLLDRNLRIGLGGILERDCDQRNTCIQDGQEAADGVFSPVLSIDPYKGYLCQWHRRCGDRNICHPHHLIGSHSNI
jgi:hypothetical protein